MGASRLRVNVSKSTAIIFARAGRLFIQPRPVTLFGEPIEWVERTRYLGVTLDTRLTWEPHIDEVRKRTAQGMLGALLKRKSDLSVRNGVLLYRVSQEECARLREGVPYVKVYRYNPKHLYPK